MKVLYIGGTGEISMACVQRSVEVGHDVTVFNRGRSGAVLPDGVRQIVGDMTDDEAYAALGAENFDTVCQFLAYDLAVVQRDVDVFGGRCGQYVFISSASAYQKPPTHTVITEDTPLANPYWPYSQKKADMEAYLFAQHAAGRIPVTVVRPSHTLRTRFPGGIARGDDWAWRILNGRPLIVHDDGTSLWTLTHSADFAVPFAGLLGTAAAVGEAFHITRHMECSTWNIIYAEMGQALGGEAKLVHVPTETLVKYNADWAGPLLGDKAWSAVFDNTKVKSVAGDWECKFSVQDALAAAAEDYRQHRAESYQPNEDLHALLDRIAQEQSALGD
jgi:nucleoside-diphosphate-sugar epimerase